MWRRTLWFVVTASRAWHGTKRRLRQLRPVRTRYSVAITIDAEIPDRAAVDPLGSLDRILTVLHDKAVPATFFVAGNWAAANPERVDAIRAAGHRIGSHSYSHTELTLLSPDDVVADLEESRRVLLELNVDTGDLFRAPYGAVRDGDIDINDAVRAAGYTHRGWNADSGDWRPGWTVADVVAKTMKSIAARSPETGTVLMHSWPDPTAGALAQVVDLLKAGRAEFVHVL